MSDAAARIFRHGWEATAFQLLGPGFAHWLDGGDGVVGYADTGGAWVAGGSPVAPAARLAESARAFVDAAREAGRRACFFAADARLAAATGWRAVRIGVEPSWDPRGWASVLARHASLRYQLRRAAHKGVTIRRLDPSSLADPSPARTAAQHVIDRWRRARRMPPMRFLVEMSPFERAPDRGYWLAEQGGAPVGFAIVSPVPARDGWFVEHVLRDGAAPNGTVELLVDAILRDALAEDRARVTLGLAPLAGPLGPVLRAARFLGSPFYDFRGLAAFKNKLDPDTWDPIDLVIPPGIPRWLAFWDTLRAFAGGPVVGFGARAVWRLVPRGVAKAGRWYARASAPR
ncbi:MAG TPA: phosphatidylglycerol lysyltransferase domain-containing protein [Kofleriaceae bacterium]|nr:phosphatidylglycerol lysyltransferase domain-containing protein [Kofleriaceae bacterium]